MARGKPFIHEDFLLTTKPSRRLYHEFAEGEPILDFHSHLSAADIAADRRFKNLFEIWLEGDHYKWRAMRANGIGERLCTGDASPYEKFLAFARTIPQALRNPLYHWTHLELKRHFGIDERLDERSAPSIWKRAGEQLPRLSAGSILKRFRVTALCTTDDPADDLAAHRAIARSTLACRVVPTFRPDKAFAPGRPEVFGPWLSRMERATGRAIRTAADLLDALEKRLDVFHAAGARMSDHGIDTCFGEPCPERRAGAIFKKARAKRPVSPAERSAFAAHVMLFLGRLYARRGWVMQLHLGARRNANTRAFRTLGPDTGFDAVGDWPQADALAGFLDRLDRDDALPKTILYNLNPADNYVVAALIGAFQDGRTPGKMQLGSGWWHLDQKEGIEWQLNALSNLGLLSRFVGMLTDSRSFLSFPRHEYFRRVLCDLVGRDVATGSLPDDDALLGPMIRAICFGNARAFTELA